MEKSGSGSSSQPSRKRGREEEEGSTSGGKSVSKAAGGRGNASGGDGVASGSKAGSSGSAGPSSSQADTASRVIPLSTEEVKTVLEKFGKEWTALSRLAIASSTFEDPDVSCAVCDDHLDDEENEIVFCDGPGCNVAVHQECYGVQVIPEGKWYCKKCKLSPRDPVTCVLCCRSIGAFKPTTNKGEWAHVLCASFIPGVSFGDYTKLEPVKGTENAVKERSKMRCSICHQKGGAPIQCASKKCCKPFHVSCARDKGLLESMAQEGPTLLPDFEKGAMPRVWCETHRPQIISNNYAQKLLKIEGIAKARLKFSRAKQTSNASVAAKRLADLCTSTLQRLPQPLPSLGYQPFPLPAPPAKTFQREGSDISRDSDSSDDDTPPPTKRFKSAHAHPADQIVDLENRLEEFNTQVQEAKDETKRLRAELAAARKKAVSDALDTDKLKGRYQKALQVLKTDVNKKDAELARLGTQGAVVAVAVEGGAEAGPSSGAYSGTAVAQEEEEEPKKKERSVESQIKSAIKKRDKEYRKPMAALQHYERTWKYWEKERERTEGFFKDKIAAETELATQITDLMIPYEQAYRSLRLPGSDEGKVVKVSQLLGEMTVLARRMAEKSGGGEGGGGAAGAAGGSV